MLLSIARSRQMMFVGGKGGTGKTTIASALALARARDGARVLLASTDPAHSLGHIWEHNLSDTPTRVHTEPPPAAEQHTSANDRGRSGRSGSVDAVEIDPHLTVQRHFARVEATMLRMLPERQHGAARRHLELAKSAPGSFESATLERIAELAGDDEHDLLIFDTAPTGHTLHLLALPERLQNWTESLLANRDRSERFAAAARGLTSTKEQTSGTDAQLRRTLLARRDRFAQLRAALLDPQHTGFILVALPEKLPAAESAELAEQLLDLGIDLTATVVNRRSPADSGDFLAHRRKQEEEHVHHLRQLHGRSGPVPLVEVPLLAADVTGRAGLAPLAGRLAASPLQR